MITYTGYDSVIKTVYEKENEHVFAYWDTLSDAEKKLLLNDLSSVDFELIEKLYALSKETVEIAGFVPAPFISIPKTSEELAAKEKTSAIGIDCIKKGKVAAFVVAGGQGSRLGFDGPKGLFQVGPVSGKSLFQIHGEKILKYSLKYGTVIPWLVMTSQLNHDETVAYFEKMNYFGLDKANIYIFPQSMIPSLDTNGKLILENSYTLFKNPDGHGGSLTALAASGVLAKMKERGISIISYFQVDNPLIKIIDPFFIGNHVLNNADVSSKSIRKAYADEKVGVFVKYQNDTIGVVEYSDMSKEDINLQDASGELLYGSGSIAVHAFSVDFVDSITSGRGVSLPFHTARKKLKVKTGNTEKEIDGLKFEKFVFDALLLTNKNIIMDTVREEEFAPVKNATGLDSLETSQTLMSNLYKVWLTERGVNIPHSVKVVEISPLTAVSFDDLPADLKVPDTEKVLL